MKITKDFFSNKDIMKTMNSIMKIWLSEALQESGLSQSSLARQLSEKMQRPIYRSAVNKMLTGERGISMQEGIAIEEITKYPLPRKKTIPLMGYVGAGSEVIPYEDGWLEEVEIPPYITKDTYAVKVEGDSMEPFIEDKSILFYSQNMSPNLLLNKKAIVYTQDGRCFVKIVKQGSKPGLFNLESLNRLYPEIKDIQLVWAAPIDWIKPPRL
ncbi:S24 family peptidase [Bartonella bovis]|uniref:Putative phage repressor n=1 Tax=Bartonella bovis 91-4 TaxID=1094491 RepID=N6VFC9_9HYPH|nr:S24 family peptidase [Bartonella bovis]ENN91951.1 putative phage repressor [Bartonella bovis 91-4]